MVVTGSASDVGESPIRPVPGASEAIDRAGISGSVYSVAVFFEDEYTHTRVSSAVMVVSPRTPWISKRAFFLDPKASLARRQ